MKRHIVKNFIIYTIPSILNRSMGLITVPIVTRFISLEIIGYLALYNLCLVPFSILSEYGAGYVINSSWFKLKKEEQKELLFTLLLLTAVICFVLVILFSVFMDYLFPRLIGADWLVIKTLFPILLMQIFCSSANSIFQSWAIINQKAVLITVLDVSQLLLGSTIYLLLVVITKNFNFIVIGNAIVISVFGVIRYFILFKEIRFNFKKIYYALVFEVGSPIFLRNLFNQARKQIDKFFVVNLFGSAQLALYNFSVKTLDAHNEVTKSFQRSYSPLLFKQLAQDEVDTKNFKTLFEIWFYFSFVCSLIIYAFGKPLVHIYANGVFDEAYPIILVFMCTMIINKLFMGTGEVLISYKKTKLILYNTIAQAIVATVLCILLIPKIGAIGAAIAIWSGVFIYNILQLIQKKKCFAEYFIENRGWWLILAFHLIVYLQVFYDIKTPLYVIILLFLVSSLRLLFLEWAFIKNKIMSFRRA